MALAVLMLTLVSIGAVAQVKVVFGEKGEEKFPGKGGTITVSQDTKGDEVTVTLTVTPDKGYTITKGDIKVYATYPPSGTRTPEIADNLTLYYNGSEKEDVKDPSAKRDYTFTIGSNFGAWVKEANFSSGSKGPQRGGIAITSLSDITDADGHYTINQDISGGTPGVTTFNGTLEAAINTETHMPYRITGLSAPLFTTLTGTVKNLVLEDVNISGNTGNTGAIAGTANSAARIYNVGILSGSVGGTENTGGIVGFLDGTARVINCYSYANITSGTNKGGIVGNNNVASSQSNVATMVMNCMFYGTISSGGTISPIYGGKNIDNKNSGGLATYNYYLYRTDLAITKDKYNCALAVEEKFLNRFEIFRQLENSNKKLASIYATGSADDADQKMLKWVLETADRTIVNPKPYPVLKDQGYYPSIINPDFANAPDSASVGRNHGGKLGSKTLSVTISSVGSNAPNGASITTGSLTLQRTDKDFDRFNFNYDKVQLPYYNDIGEGNYTGNRVVTGWKITSITGGTAGTYSAADEFGGYNFADRNCTNKDKFDVSGRVFSQGAYFEVPYGVTGITIEPYWGVAAYVSDQYYDVVYKEDGDKNYAGQNVNVASAGLGTQATNDTNITINGSTQKVYTSIDNARKSLSISTNTASGKTVYDYAVVLVGNVHQAGPLSGDYTPYTITSVDLDKDNEPDYSFIFSHHNRQAVSPIRFDFLNVVGTAQAQKPNGTSRMLNVSIFNPKGWFEVTNTCSIYFVQFEGDNGNKTSAPIILLGGAFDQFTSTQSQKVTTSQQYIHLGSNCWFKAFGNGTHGDGWSFTSHVPVSVTGGDFDGFYLSGVYRPDAGIQQDNAECYISSGRFNEVAGAAQQMIDGDVHWQIYNADITNFYGGGINAAKPITGDITVDIFNSHVDTYCGGPKFGDMQKSGTTFTTKYSTNKAGSSTGTYSRAITKDGKVTTNATGCHFKKFFGAGYGGTSYSELKFADATSYNFTTLANNYINDRGKYFTGTNTDYKSDYGNKGPGVATDFSYEFFVWSRGQVGARFYVKYASFSLAQCNDVESKLKKCIIENNFYGGGSIGKVDGTATSELEDCEVKGSVYGGGYSASLPATPVRNGGFTTIPKFNSQSGMFEPGVFSETTDFDWTSGTLTENTKAINESGGKHDIYTNVDLTILGEVANTNLNITGTTTVAGSVFGGGEESNVKGNTQVNITGGTITQNVFGGGKGKDDNFTCDKAMVGDNDEGACENPASETNKNKGTKVIISNGTVNGNVYGGGEVGRVEWNTQVEIGVGSGDGQFAPVIKGSVFGAGAGKETHGYSALVRGNSTVTVQGNAKVLQNVYGGGEKATVGRYWVKGIPTTPCNNETAPSEPTDLPDGMPYQQRSGGICKVVIQGQAQIGPNDGGNEDVGHVFGAGKGVVPHFVQSGEGASQKMIKGDENNPDRLVAFDSENAYLEFLQTLALVTNTDVTIGGGAKVKGSVFGGSESGYVQHNTNVLVSGGTIGTAEQGGAYYGNVYGGGKGDAEHTGSNDNYLAAGIVKGSTKVKIEGGTILHNIYGGGAYGSVGVFDYDTTSGLPTGLNANAPENSGKAEIHITGGTIGTTGEVNGMIFGSSRGDVGAPDAIHDKLAWVYDTHVAIGDTTENATITTAAPLIRGSIYGGGENGHNFRNSYVRINGGTIGIPSEATYAYRGNVYGGGCGTDKYDNDTKYNPKAGIVQGNAFVNITGGFVVHNVYGAGAMGSVGTDTGGGKTTVSVSGGRIGYDGNSNGNVYGAARGDLTATGNLAQVRETAVNISYSTTPTADNEGKTAQLIAGSVFGGGEAGTVKESVAVSMTGGLILNDVYGGGALANTQTSNWDATANDNAGGWADADKKSALHTTTVRLTGGRVGEEVYGGGLGETGKPAYVWGDVKVELNKGIAITGVKGCVVNQIFGCNNLNGTPKGDVEVHVYNTQRAGATQIVNDADANVTNAKVAGKQDSNGDFELNSFDVAAVYGGGNQADYIPVDGTNQKTYVVIEGCDRTSIGNVYGGGNAAAVPGTHVLIKGSYEIGEVFGGGNGAKEGTRAHVGKYNETEEDYILGDGKALVQLMAGKVKFVYGGSNTRGNIRGGATVNNVDNEWTKEEGNQADCCENMQVGQIFAGGKNADMASGADVVLGCTNSNDWVEEIYAGARRANVGGDVSLTITSGKFGRVFGGNMISGKLNGSITVNIEENGVCGIPVIIGELYGGGNLAAYSIYGYNDNGTVKTSGDNPHASPVVNVRAFTSIGNIFGGGYGNTAVMVGSPTININEAAINHEDKTNEYQGNQFSGTNLYFVNSVLNLSITSDPTDMTNVYKVVVPDHTDGKIGAIGNIYGGGNAAEVQGDTHVNIGTDTEVYVVRPDLTVTDKVKGFYTRSWNSATKTYDYTLIEDADKTAEEGVNYYQKRDVAGADIRGNVYGGGNNAAVTGNTNVVIGKRSE